MTVDYSLPFGQRLTGYETEQKLRISAIFESNTNFFISIFFLNLCKKIEEYSFYLPDCFRRNPSDIYSRGVLIDARSPHSLLSTV